MSPMTEKAASFLWQVCSISVNLTPFGLSIKQRAVPQENSRRSQYSVVSKHVFAGHSGTATFSAGDQRLQRAAVVVASAQVHGRALPKNTPGSLLSFGLHHLHLLHTIDSSLSIIPAVLTWIFEQNLHFNFNDFLLMYLRSDSLTEQQNQRVWYLKHAWNTDIEVDHGTNWYQLLVILCDDANFLGTSKPLKRGVSQRWFHVQITLKYPFSWRRPWGGLELIFWSLRWVLYVIQH